jgi:hypothetical protein
MSLFAQWFAEIYTGNLKESLLKFHLIRSKVFIYQIVLLTACWMKHNGWKFHYNTVYKNWRVWVKLILIKIRDFIKKMYFVLIYILQHFLYKASSLHLCTAVILVFICSTISCFWQRQSTQLSCKFWAPHQVQLILWRITLQVEKLWFKAEAYENKLL